MEKKPNIKKKKEENELERKKKNVIHNIMRSNRTKKEKKGYFVEY